MNKKNMAASVRARLKTRARETHRPFQELLQYYAMERFLYRLSRSSYHRRFILKGALMLRVWGAPLSRPTRDVDLLGQVNNDVENLVSIVQEVCREEVEPDGIAFAPSSVTGAKIKEDAEYSGVRLKFIGRLDSANISMQLDVGFGDVVIPPVTEVEYPTLLDLPAPRLWAYPRETVIAEKFQAMVFLGALNSRMKDFYDIWLLARQFDFDGQTLARAIKATFANRETEIDPDPVAFNPDFVESDEIVRRWAAFIRKGQLVEVPATLADLTTVIAGFLRPVAVAVRHSDPFDMKWSALGPWSPSL